MMRRHQLLVLAAAGVLLATAMAVLAVVTR